MSLERHLLVLSADGSEALAEQARRWADHLEQHPEVRAADVCFTAAVGRSHRVERLACVGATAADLAAGLRAYLASGPAGVAARGGAAATATRLAFVFTGQGSQYAGMARGLYQRWPVFRRALERCDAITRPWLDHSLLDVLFQDSSPASIDDTAWTQPALFGVEHALCELLESWGVHPDVVMGHSIGEYVAAWRAGVFGLEDALRLVVARGKLMAATPPGAMWSVRAGEERVAPLLAGRGADVALAAVNAPDQVVLSGAPEALEEIVAALRAEAVECRALRVSHAFHSPRMEGALAPFRTVVESVARNAPSLPLISNVSGEPAGDELLTADYWVRHLRAPVAFAAGLRALVKAGVQAAVEIGPHPSLSAMAAATLPADAMTWIPTLRRERDDQTQILGALGRIHTMGVPVAWQAFYEDQGCRRVRLPTYPFQRQRYWNTDVRWAPAATSLTMGAQTAPRPPRDAWQVAWVERSLDAPARPAGTWLLCDDNGGASARLAATLEAAGARVVRAAPAERTSQDWESLFGELAATGLRGVVDVRGLEICTDASAELAVTAATRALLLFQGLEAARLPSPPRLWLLTRGAFAIGDAAPVSGAARGLWGFARVAGNEGPGFGCTAVDLDPAAPPDEMLHVTESLLRADAEDQLALRRGKRLVARLEHLPLPAAAPRALGDTWLVTGGLGALGQRVARWLAERGVRRVVLLGRSAGGPEAEPLRAELNRSGTEASIHRVDVTDRAALAQVLDELRAGGAQLAGVVHAAGVLSDGALSSLDPARLRDVMAPKVSGAWNLHELTRGDGLSHFILFSSTTALLGNPGQANYAAANAALDGLAEARRAAGLPALSVQWGPWSGGGMSTRTAILRRHRVASTLEELDPAEALAVLERLLGQDRAVVAVGGFRWDLLGEALGGATPPLLADLMRPSEKVPGADLAAEIRALEPAAREARIGGWLREQLARLIGQPVDDPQQNLVGLGADSLMVVELLTALRRDLGLMMYPREFYQHPSIAALAGYLSHELGGGSRPPEARTEHGAATPLTVPPWAGRRAGPRAASGPRNPRAVFVLSSPRSGSTLLRVMLAGHPSLFSPPELHLLAFDNLQERGEALAGSYLDEGLQRAIMELDGLDAPASRALLQEWLEQDKSVREVYAYLQARAGSRLLVDKSPSYAASLDTLLRAEEMFEGARFVHLARHPYAVIESFTRMRMDRMMLAGGHDPLHVAEQSWLLSNRNLLALREHIDPARYHLMRYEDMVLDLEGASRALCDFLEIPFDPAVLKPYEGKRMTDGVHAQSMPIDDPNFHTHKGIETDLADVWRKIRLPRALDPESQEVARALGYELPVEDAAPGAGRATREERAREIRGLRQVASIWGPEEGPPVVLLHGLLDHGAAWASVAEPLASRGFRVLAPDLRGHGLSAHVGPEAGYQLLDFVADLDAWTANERAPIVVGHSFGASVAALFARLRPQRVRALVLVEPGLPAARPAGDPFADLGLQLDHLGVRPAHPVLPDLEAAALRLRQQVPVLSDALARRTAERLTEPCPGGLRWRWDARLTLRTFLHSSVQGFDRGDHLALLGRLARELPVFALFGATSAFNRPEDREAQLVVLTPSRCRLVAGGHFLHIETPAEVTRLVLAAADATAT